MATDKNTLKSWFVNGAKPNQAQYAAWLDSYYHKAEGVAMEDIRGLGDLIGSKADAKDVESKANKDSNNLSPENVEQWKQKLGVGELPENIATIDLGDKIGNAYKKINYSFEEDDKTYVLNIDGTAVDADLFGKNITNSDNTTTGSFIQTQRRTDTFDWETNGARYALKSLPEKSGDGSFKDFVGKNEQGQLAKVGFPAFLNSFETFSPAQSLQLSHLLNGGIGSAGAISVNLISPPVVQNIFNENTYVLLRGANLFLNSQQMKVEILGSDKASVVATIPNNQVQLDTGGTTLTFYYNFKNIAQGQYFVRLTSGAKSYISTIDLRVVQSIENIDINNIRWTKKYAEGVVLEKEDNLNGGGFYIESDKALPPSFNVTKSFKSTELFSSNDNFYIEINITLNKVEGGQAYVPSYIGIGDSQQTQTLIPSCILFFDWSWASSRDFIYGKNNGQGNIIVNQPNAQITFAIVKTSNFIRSIITTHIGTYLFSKTLETDNGFSVLIENTSRVGHTVTQGKITKAFKFN